MGNEYLNFTTYPKYGSNLSRLITYNDGALAMCLCFHKNKNGKGIATNAMLNADENY